jgi:4-amino-4-deoxy-L-arabinose transferase-like glycosyltransferase
MNKFLSLVRWFLVILMVVVAFILMFNASFQESATMDELAHIPAGYGYVKYLDYRLNPEHPPLVKALAGLPLLFQKVNFPLDRFPWQSDINGQWAAGAQFLYESDNNADRIIQWSRLGPMLLTLLLIIFIYIWAKELIGRWWAFLPTSLFAFSPNVLAHGHYVATDIGAALGIFMAAYYFVKFLLEPSGRHLIFAGVAFGIAQLMKFSAALLIPLFIFLLAVFYIWKTASDWQTTAPLARFKRFFIRAFRYSRALALIFIIGYALVYAVYFLFTINYPIEKQAADTKYILTSFAGGPDSNFESCKLKSGVALPRRVRCLAEINIYAAGNKILRPFGEYLLGVLMVMQRSAGGNTAYFLGEVSASGWWYYFPVVFVLKEPIPSLILISVALLFAIWRIIKNSHLSSLTSHFFNYLGTHFAEFSMIAFIVLYWAYSVKSPLNIGVRHLMPTMPFVYILTSGAIKKFISSGNFVKIFVKGLFIAILLIWYFGETLFAGPYYLSYFNQFGGGVENGYKYVTDSNYDWGQDLKRLKSFVESWNMNHEARIEKVAVDYFGGGNPKYYLGEKAEYWQSAKGNPKYYGIDWLAVSVNTLQGALGKLHPGQPRNPENEYRWLKDPYEPYARAGTSIFIYKL